MKTLRVITPTSTMTFGYNAPPATIVFVFESGVRIYAGPNPGPDRIEIRTGEAAALDTMVALRCVMSSVEDTTIRIDDAAVVIGVRLAGSDDMIPLRVIRLGAP